MSHPTHQNDLLVSGRCGRCAERVSRSLILRAETCPHCESELSWSGGEVLDELETRQARWRLLGYALVGLASFAAGTVPLLQLPVQLAALFILHIVILRRGLEWLPPGRRVLTRLTIKLLGAAIAVTALLVNVAIAPFLGVSALVLAAVGPVLTAAYVEGGLAILRQRLRWESDDRSLTMIEWGLPAAILLVLVIAVATTVGIVMGTLHLLASAEIPSISELAVALLELSQ